jgi:hypothetical protein
MHFRVFNSLYCSDLSRVRERRFLAFTCAYLMRTKSQAGLAASKAGNGVGSRRQPDEVSQRHGRWREPAKSEALPAGR